MAPVLQRMSIYNFDTFSILPLLSKKDVAEANKDLPSIPVPDVIFLDPMYPLKSKMKALPRKEMMVAR